MVLTGESQRVPEVEERKNIPISVLQQVEGERRFNPSQPLLSSISQDISEIQELGRQPTEEPRVIGQDNIESESQSLDWSNPDDIEVLSILNQEILLPQFDAALLSNSPPVPVNDRSNGNQLDQYSNIELILNENSSNGIFITRTVMNGTEQFQIGGRSFNDNLPALQEETIMPSSFLNLQTSQIMANEEESEEE